MFTGNFFTNSYNLSMKKKVFVIHGWGGSPDGNWFRWLEKELSMRNYDVYVPAMPNAESPVKDEWLLRMENIIGKPDGDIILVGHSLGVIAILRYLEQLLENEKIGLAVLVSGFLESLGIPEIENFITPAVDYAKIRKKARKFIAINSDDDEYVPLPVGRDMAQKLGAEFIVMKGAGHIMAPYGKFKLPLALEKILENG